MVRIRLLICTVLMVLGLLSALVLMAFSPVLTHDTAFAEQNLIRIHVLANSNTPKDQDLKLLVRDAVLAETRGLLKDISQKEQAHELIIQHQNLLEQVAQEVVLKEGFDYPVEVEMGKFAFPTRVYGSLEVPEGWYDAVRIKIGSATGDNWWCVLFPPLCLGEMGDSSQLVKVNEEITEVSWALRWKMWDHLAQTEYAQAFQRWWQASAAAYPVISE